MLLYPYICNADSPYIYGVDLMGNNDDISVEISIVRDRN